MKTRAPEVRDRLSAFACNWGRLLRSDVGRRELGPTMRNALPLLFVSLVLGCATLPKADQELFAAIKRDDALEVERLAVSGANINAKDDRDHERLPPLAWVAVWGSSKS